MTRWFWIRHAEIDQNIQDRDPPIAPLLSPISHELPKTALWLTSPLKRAQQTAKAIGAPNDIRIAPAFREQNFGLWESMNWAKVAETSPKEHASFWDNPAQERPPEGESFEDLYHRVTKEIDQWNEQKKDIVVISHAGPIRAALGHALGWEGRLETLFAIEVPYLHLVQLDYIGPKQWIVHFGRDIQHRNSC